jgi:beta-D-xylosidase 4
MLGVPSVTSNDTSHIQSAVEMAKAAEHVILVLGQDGSIEHEGHDRFVPPSPSLCHCFNPMLLCARHSVGIELFPAQQKLLAAVAAAATKAVTVVILTGGAVDVADMLANDKVGAIIHAGQPSVTVTGVADLIFGKSVPAGRMIQTIYPKSFAGASYSHSSFARSWLRCLCACL